MSPTSRSSEPEDVRLRFGMDPPRLEETRHWEELVPGADERPARGGRFVERETRIGVIEYWVSDPVDEDYPDDADGEA